MKIFNPLTTLALALILSNGALAANTCDCGSIAGLWKQVDSETQVTTFLKIPASCTNVQIQQNQSQSEDWNMITDRILCEKGSFRIQYRFRNGYVDEDGVKFGYPLPQNVAEALRGDLREFADGSISLGIDAIDSLCVMNDGKPCESSHFVKTSESEPFSPWYE